MFNLYMFCFSVLLFFVLTPGIIITIPPKSSKTTVALIHALVFATVWTFIYKLVFHVTENFYSKKEEQTVNEKIEAVKAAAAAQAQAEAAKAEATKPKI